MPVKISCVTPTAPGREHFMELCRKYVARFTMRPEEHIVVSSADYRQNVLEGLRRSKTEITAIIEDDDWYHPGYLEDMCGKLRFSKRLIIGYDPSIYYHIQRRKFAILPHRGRASLYTMVGMTSTLYPACSGILQRSPECMLDIALWEVLSDVGVTTVDNYAVGIKHFMTRTHGGAGHFMSEERLSSDADFCYLKTIMGEEDVERYVEFIRVHGGDGTVLP